MSGDDTTQPSAELTFLKEEYLHIQKTIEDFDQRALTIKAWSVTLSMAGIGAAFTQKVPILLLLAAAASLCFWIVEALWKTFQNAYYPRVEEIERFWRGEQASLRPFQIASSWIGGWRQRKTRRILLWPHIMLPHVLVAIAGVVIWVADQYLRFIPRS